MPFSIPPRMAAYAAVVALIFFLGYRAASLVCSGRYEALRASYAERIEEQRQRNEAESTRIADAAEERERELLAGLEARRDEYDALAAQIDLTPVILPERRVATGEPADCGPRVDWASFGRLYDRAAAAAGQAAADHGAAGGDTAGETATDPRR